MPGRRNATTYRTAVAQMPSNVAQLLAMILGKQRAVDVFQSVLRLTVDLFQVPEEQAFIRIADPTTGVTKNYTTLRDPFAPNYLNDLSGITGRAMRLKQPQRVSDATRDRDFVVYATQEKHNNNSGHTRSELAIPLMFGDECYGVMNFESPQPHWFEESDIQWGLLSGTFAAIAEHQEQRPDTSPGYVPIIEESIRRQIGAVLDEVLNRLNLSAHAMAEVMLYADQVQELLTLELRPPSSSAFHRILRLGEGLTGRYFTAQRPYAGPVLQQSLGEITHLLSSRSVLIVPLSRAGKPIGVLNVESSDPEALTPVQLEAVTSSNLPSRIEKILARIDMTSISRDQVKEQLIDGLRQRVLETVGTENPQDIYTQILQVASQVVDAPDVSAGLILIRDENQNLSTRRNQNLADKYAVRAARIGAFDSEREWPMTERSIAKRVITTLQTARVPDVRKDEDYKDSGTGAAESSELIAPLRSTDSGGIGVIGLVSPGLNRFSPTDQEYLELVAKIAEYAIQRSEDIRQTRRQAQQLVLQGELLKLIEEKLFLSASAVDFNAHQVEEVRDEIFVRIIEWAVNYTVSQHVAIVLAQTTEGRGEYLSIVAKTASDLIPNAPPWWPRDEGVSGEAFTTGRTINSRDNQATSGTAYVDYFLGAKSEVAAPIRIGSNILGVLDVESNMPFHYTNHYVQWAEFLAQQMAFALIVIEAASRRRFEVELAALSHHVDDGIREMPAMQEWTPVRLHRNKLIREVVDRVVALTGAHVGRMIMSVNAYDETGAIDLVNGRLVNLASTDHRELEESQRYFPITDGVTSRAFIQQRDIVYNDRASRPEGYFDTDRTRNCRSGIFVPILQGTHCVGVLDVESLDEGKFTPDAVQAVHEASDIILKLLVAGRQRLDELLTNKLLQFERQILLSLSADKKAFMEKVLAFAALITDFSDGWGAVLNLRPWGNRESPTVDSTFTARYTAGKGTFFGVDDIDHSPPTHPALLRAVRTKRPVLILGTVDAAPLEQQGFPWKDALVGSLICVPLMKPVSEGGTTVVGLLVLASPKLAEFSEPDKQVLTTYAETIIGGMKNVATLDVSKNLLEELRHDANAALMPLLRELEKLDLKVQSAVSAAELEDVPRRISDMHLQVKQIHSWSRLVNDTLTALLDFSNSDLEPETPNDPRPVASIVQPLEASVNELAKLNEREMIWVPLPSLYVFGGEKRSKMARAVLFKFLDNAIKYGDPGTPVLVRCRAGIAEASIEVVSRGKIVPQEERTEIWSLEYRGSNVAPGTSGSGLGLYQAKVIANRLNGEVDYRSEEHSPEEPDENIFALRLPIAQAARL